MTVHPSRRDSMVRRLTMTIGGALALLATSAAAQTKAQMNQQAGAAYRQADAQMTQAWRVLYADMKKRDSADGSRGGGFGYAAAALASQRAWLQFRDKQCVLEGAEFAGGSLQPMAQVRCLAKVTRARTQQLKGMQWTK
ncbi:lysozyme inhibitor LprI family protein [Sphingomonas yunnanensis]|uniref:lysozyme inhibitor LprI family protein n=1 Tax=Sphingomonas yunnanensis TaxID=310400 RepID=UPI0031BBCD2A